MEILSTIYKGSKIILKVDNSIRRKYNSFMQFNIKMFAGWRSWKSFEDNFVVFRLIACYNNISGKINIVKNQSSQ